jgi:hypothetical protein
VSLTRHKVKKVNRGNFPPKCHVTPDSDSMASSLHKAHALHASHKAVTDQNLDNCWILESGATRTMTHNRSWFSHFMPLRSPIAIALGDNSTINNTGVGHVSI